MSGLFLWMEGLVRVVSDFGAIFKRNFASESEKNEKFVEGRRAVSLVFLRFVNFSKGMQVCSVVREAARLSVGAMRVSDACVKFFVEASGICCVSVLGSEFAKMRDGCRRRVDEFFVVPLYYGGVGVRREFCRLSCEDGEGSCRGFLKVYSGGIYNRVVRGVLWVLGVFFWEKESAAIVEIEESVVPEIFGEINGFGGKFCLLSGMRDMRRFVEEVGGGSVSVVDIRRTETKVCDSVSGSFECKFEGDVESGEGGLLSFLFSGKFERYGGRLYLGELSWIRL